MLSKQLDILAILTRNTFLRWVFRENILENLSRIKQKTIKIGIHVVNNLQIIYLQNMYAPFFTFLNY